MLDLIITSATVVNATGRSRAHVGIADGKIVGLYDPNGEHPAAQRTIDGDGRLLIPGGVDSHCHVEQITGKYKSLDTYEVAGTGALHGGTTTIIDFAIPADANETPLAAFAEKRRLMSRARCDVALHGSVIHWDETIPMQLEQLTRQGVRSVKLYTTNRGTTMADDDTIVRVMKEMVRLDGLTYIHAEHDAIVSDRTRTCAANGNIGISALPMSRPALSEAASVREILAVAKYAGAPVYFVHQTTRAAVDAVAEARARGQVAFSETCPHYMLLDDTVYSEEDAEGFACCPPIRPAAERNGLLDRLAVGQIDVVASDHSCYDRSQKMEHRDDVRRMPHGLPGVETRMPAAFTALVTQSGMSVERFVELFSTSPAMINGLQGKGVIGVGYDADLVLFDPEETRVVDGGRLHQGTDYSPFDGLTLQGWPSTVVSAGRVVLNDGIFRDPGPVGRYLPRTGFRSSRRGSASQTQEVQS